MGRRAAVPARRWTRSARVGLGCDDDERCGATAAPELEQSLDSTVGAPRDDDDLAGPRNGGDRASAKPCRPRARRPARPPRARREPPPSRARGCDRDIGSRAGAVPTMDTRRFQQNVRQRERSGRANGRVEARAAGRPATPSGSWSRMIARSSRGASSSSFTIRRPRRAVLGQWTARSGSPGT